MKVGGAPGKRPRLPGAPRRTVWELLMYPIITHISFVITESEIENIFIKYKYYKSIG